MKLNVDHPKIIRKVAKSFAGDESPYPYRSGPMLVNFFKSFGYNDKYRSGFPTRWVYVEEKIIELNRKNLFEEFLKDSLSIEELISMDVDIAEAESLQKEIITYLNHNIFVLTEKELKVINGEIRLVKKEEDKPVGSGHFADVYPFYKDGKKYAVKKLKREFWTNTEAAHRFKREYELMRKLNGSGYTVNVDEYNDIEKSFTMDFADTTLKDFIDKNNNTMNDMWKEHICEKIIIGLKELHKSTLHRDLSYNNILMINNDPKLADFGLGKDKTVDYSFKTITEQGVGTAHFTDPIQMHNFKDANIQTDIYSLGRIIDFIFNGSIVSQEHKYSGVVTRATSRDLSKRYTTVDELFEAYQSLKNSNYDYDPLTELLEMSKVDKFSSEKLYKIFTRKDASNILFQLILNHYNDAVKIAQLISVQYEQEFEILLESLNKELKENRLSFSEYDNFGYFSMDLILEIGRYSEATNTLTEILRYVAHSVNRFSIKKLIEKNKNNSNIPFIIRDKLT
jgi:serine/threonine protein kinase